ncbi:fimbrial biogenesis chaperone [Enterobacter mori]|uniref:fimbrial biogenesis chaperone n=1 Tax=Enterobacter mori TaxID=539813 RepID=UPI001B8D7A2C|nr:molecular chaperone [Enterobacter mori]MBS3045958.1 fimbria/pilus periplasmic chaperone [Enterobacter mori]
MKLLSKSLLLGLLTLSVASSVNAGVVVGGTRVIYDGGKKEASLSVNNPDSVPYLIQSWIDTQTGGVEKAPFIITPPLFRLDQGQQNVMRIVRAGNVPEDKESMFWLNVKSIPSAEKKENSLQVAVKTRMKLIYRPTALKGTSPEELADKLTWQKAGDQIQVTNPTPYYMNFNEISVGGKKVAEPTYVAPGSSARFALPAGANAGQVVFKIISDFGGIGESHKAMM